MVRGIGSVYAKKLVRAFGDKVFDTIEAEPERLREVTVIGPVRANRITAAWAVVRRTANHDDGVEVALLQFLHRDPLRQRCHKLGDQNESVGGN
jgi:hypothetical protein